MVSSPIIRSGSFIHAPWINCPELCVIGAPTDLIWEHLSAKEKYVEVWNVSMVNVERYCERNSRTFVTSDGAERTSENCKWFISQCSLFSSIYSLIGSIIVTSRNSHKLLSEFKLVNFSEVYASLTKSFYIKSFAKNDVCLSLPCWKAFTLSLAFLEFTSSSKMSLIS